LADETERDAVARRVAETVRRALLLVGPSEHGIERLPDDAVVETPAA
jgi:hypothetical protein